MKKNSQRKSWPKPRPTPQASQAGQAASKTAAASAPELDRERQEHRHNHGKVGVISSTPGDTLDEIAEHKPNKWIPIYIAVLAVLLAIAVTGSNDAMKIAQQAGFGVNDTFAFYQAKTIRQGNIQLALNDLNLKLAEKPNPADMPQTAKDLYIKQASDYDAEIKRLESNGRNGKKELLAKAEACENTRAVALAQHPMYDYSVAMFQIAIVLASASIVAGTRMLFGGSLFVATCAIFFMLNGYALFLSYPEAKHKYLDEMRKTNPQFSVQCIEE